MIQEEKDLLLRDLYARLPYGVKFKADNEECIREIHYIKDEDVYIREYQNLSYWVDTIKPYLRPMSSMTEEEKEELKQEHFKDERLFAECLTKMKNGDSSMRGKVIPHFASDWCNKNHFDYRGLIEKGLALEAPKGMYKLKEK